MGRLAGKPNKGTMERGFSKKKTIPSRVKRSAYRLTGKPAKVMGRDFFLHFSSSNFLSRQP